MKELIKTTRTTGTVASVGNDISRSEALDRTVDKSRESVRPPGGVIDSGCAIAWTHSRPGSRGMAVGSAFDTRPTDSTFDAPTPGALWIDSATVGDGSSGRRAGPGERSIKRVCIDPYRVGSGETQIPIGIRREERRGSRGLIDSHRGTLR